MSSGFAANVNYVAKLDNTYGKSINIVKTNILMTNKEYSIGIGFKIYNSKNGNTTSISTNATNITSLNLIEKSEELRTELLALMSSETNNPIVTVDISGTAFATITVNISIVDNFLLDPDMIITSGNSLVYNVNGTVLNTVKILPYVSMMSDDAMQGIIAVKDNIDSIVNISENVESVSNDMLLAKSWAESTVEVEPGKYSSKHYSIQSKESMDDAKKIAIGNGEQTLSDGTVGYSAKHYAETSSALKEDVEVIRDDIEDDLSDVIKIVMNPEDAQYTLSDGTTTGYSAKHYHEKIIDLNAVSLSNIALTNDYAQSALLSKDAAALSAANALASEERLTELDVKLSGIEDGAEVNVNADWEATSGDAKILNKPTTVSGYGITDVYTKDETAIQLASAVAALIDSSPSTLDTLNELAAALGDDPNFATTTSTALGNRVVKNVDIVAGTSTKVTYDVKGLVTSGTTLSASDIPTIEASNVSITPVGSVTATSVQAAIEELDNDKEPANANIQGHISSISNPHNVTKTQVGLSNVDNTSDANKPISTLQATAINGLDSRIDIIEGTLESSHISRADKWLAAQSVANMLYTDGKLSKVRYNTNTDTDYEVMAYTSEKLSNVAHYTSAVLRGNTALSYTDGKLVSAIYTGV